MLALFVAVLGATYADLAAHSVDLPAGRGSGLFLRRDPASGRRLAERTDAVAEKVRDILQSTPGVDIVGSISGLNFLTNAAQSNSAVEFAILKPWDERPADAERLAHRRRRAAEAAWRFPKPSC